MGRNFRGSWARYLNGFPLAMTTDIYKNWRNEPPTAARIFSLVSMFAASQRNAATTWTGDIGASGISIATDFRRDQSLYVGNSILDIRHRRSCARLLRRFCLWKGEKIRRYQELSRADVPVRRLRSYLPFTRIGDPREIWEMGEIHRANPQGRQPPLLLMPYIYSLAWMVTDKDYTMMRGLPMDFPADKKNVFYRHQFMFDHR